MSSLQNRNMTTTERVVAKTVYSPLRRFSPLRKFSPLRLGKFAALLLLILLSSCSNYKKIAVKSVQLTQIEMDSFTAGKIGVGIVVDNPTSATIKIESAEAQLLLEERVFATLESLEATAFQPKGISGATCWLRLKIVDAKALLKLGLDPSRWQSKGVTANYSLLLSNGSISKRFKENGIPMEQLYNRFAKREAPETR